MPETSNNDNEIVNFVFDNFKKLLKHAYIGFSMI